MDSLKDHNVPGRRSNGNDAPHGEMKKLKIVSWNLLHRSGAMVEDIAGIVGDEKPDLFLMQEVTEVISTLPTLVGGQFFAQQWPGRHHGLAAWAPTRLHGSSPLELPASRMPGRLPTRFAQVLQIDGVTIANVHLSHGQILNRRQLRQIAQSTDGPTAIIGDFNVFGPIMLKGFSDVGPRGSTHHAQELVPFRLDRCMARDLQIIDGWTLRRGPSDHRPIVIEFSYK